MKSSSYLAWVFLLVTVLGAAPASALVNYAAGALEVNGLQLLQDDADPKRYYYLPPAPRVATAPDGSPRFFMAKFIDPEGKTNGGLFHALITLSLPPDMVEDLQQKLRESVPGAVIAGPVPLREAKEASFQVVSSVLGDKGFTRKLLSSGHAPLTPGSNAAISATLDQHGATLLWDSLEAPTSDVSLAISAWYEARIPSYRAEIHADISTVYDHFSRILNRQKNYSRTQLRKIFDQLVRDGVLEIKILDRLPEDAANRAMQQLTDLASSKLIGLIFDTETGLTKLPEKEVAVEKGQIAGRRRYGKIARLFLTGKNPKYITENQYVLKKRKDINRGVFSIRLERSTVIKVPFHTAGNLSGFFQAHKDNGRLFRIIDLADPAFQRREVYFRVDGEFADVFEGRMNFASVLLRKQHPGHPDTTGQVIFSREDVRNGVLTKGWHYARLGEASADWLRYQYHVTWSLRGRKALDDPPGQDSWQTTNLPVLTLAPPLDRHDLVIDADRLNFDLRGARSALLEARYRLFGKPVEERIAILRYNDGESTNEKTLFVDTGQPISYRVTWYMKGNAKPVRGDWHTLEQDYLVLSPPGDR